MSSNLRHTVRLFAVLFTLCVFVQLVAASEATPEVETTSAEAVSATTGDAGLEAPTGACATDSAAAATTVDFAEFDSTKQWGRQNVSSCTYTCPGGLVALCPDRIDHVKSCVNGCCVLTPSCSGSCVTHDDCSFPLICNGSTNCCVNPN